MYRLFPCIPIFRAFFFFKSAKRMHIYDYDKNRIDTLCFDVKKGISRLLRQVAAKHTAEVFFCEFANFLTTFL